MILSAKPSFNSFWISRSLRPQRLGVDALGDGHVVIAPVGIPEHLHPFGLAQLEGRARGLPAGDAAFLGQRDRPQRNGAARPGVDHGDGDLAQARQDGVVLQLTGDTK